jgi:hypothetical protein
MKTLWRVLRYIVLSALVLIILALIILSISFGKLSFKDDFVVKQDYASYYPKNYELARQRFRNLSDELSRSFSGVQLQEVKVPSEIDSTLTVGVCYVPSLGEMRNIIILSSGVHGVEAYAGHAAQELFAHHFLNLELTKNTGVLLLHAVNPYGFKYTRRVTENNVDLNRNSPSTDDLFETINEGYPQVYDLINPHKEVNPSSIENRFFFVKAVNEIRKSSMPVLRQAVLQGQYLYPEGLYFGGYKPEPQIDSLGSIILRIVEPYQRVMAVDIHTGYGQRGKLHFFPNPLEGEAKQKLESLYKGYSIDWGDSDDFYTVTGEFVGFVGKLLQDKEFYPMVIEYGTLNSQTTMGSLQSIHLMIMENQGYHYGYASQEDSVRVKTSHLEMYAPSSPSWRNYVMEQTQNVFETVIPRFVSEEF